MILNEEIYGYLKWYKKAPLHRSVMVLSLCNLNGYTHHLLTPLMQKELFLYRKEGGE